MCVFSLRIWRIYLAWSKRETLSQVVGPWSCFYMQLSHRLHWGRVDRFGAMVSSLKAARLEAAGHGLWADLDGHFYTLCLECLGGMADVYERRPKSAHRGALCLEWGIERFLELSVLSTSPTRLVLGGALWALGLGFTFDLGSMAPVKNIQLDALALFDLGHRCGIFECSNR